MLGGKLAAGDVADIIVDVTRGHMMPVAAAVEILKQLLPGQFLKLSHDPPKRTVGNGHFMLHSALAPEAHPYLSTIVMNLAAEQCGRAEALVLFGIFLIADA